MLFLLGAYGASSDGEHREQAPNEYCGRLWRCSSPQQAQFCASWRPQSIKTDDSQANDRIQSQSLHRIIHCGSSASDEPDPQRPRYLVTEAGLGYRLHADDVRG